MDNLMRTASTSSHTMWTFHSLASPSCITALQFVNQSRNPNPGRRISSDLVCELELLETREPGGIGYKAAVSRQVVSLRKRMSKEVARRGKSCIACTAVEQPPSPPVVPRSRRQGTPTGQQKSTSKEKLPKLHRSWHPGNRTSAPNHSDVQKDKQTFDVLKSGPQHGKDGSDPAPAASTSVGMVFRDDFEEVYCAESDNEEETETELVQIREGGAQGSARDLNCQHFPRCSGCTIDKMLDQPPVLQDATQFFVKHGVPDFCLTSGSVWEWRCRAKLAVRGTSQDPQIGLFEEGTHDIVNIPSCRAHHPSINAAVELVKEAIRELGVQPYDDHLFSGELRYVQMVVTTFNTSLPAAERYANGKVQISLVWNARDEHSMEANNLNRVAEKLWRMGNPKSSNPIVHSVWANFQTSCTNVIFGGRWRHLLGEPELWERVGGADIAYTPASFGQANLQEFDALLRRLQKAVKIGSAVVELYAGVGIIGLSLAATRKCRVVKCVEVNKDAKASFELSLSRLPPSVNSDISWHCADASVSPIHWLEGADVVIVDPPRKGLDPEVIDGLRTASLRGQGKSKAPSSRTTRKVEKRPWILRAQQGGVHKESSIGWEQEDGTWPRTLIYVSCGWQAFKLDYSALIEGDLWHLDDAHAFNFFPGTDSIEVLAIFKRGKRLRKLVKKGSGVRSKSAKSLRWTKAAKEKQIRAKSKQGSSR